MTATLLATVSAVVLVVGPVAFVGGKLHERRYGPCARANAAAVAAGVEVGARHFDVASDVQAGPMTTRVYGTPWVPAGDHAAPPPA